jgi:hypothetical protein
MIELAVGISRYRAQTVPSHLVFDVELKNVGIITVEIGPPRPTCGCETIYLKYKKLYVNRPHDKDIHL